MKIRNSALVITSLLAMMSCTENAKKEIKEDTKQEPKEEVQKEVKEEATSGEYFDVLNSSSTDNELLFAITDEEYLEYGSRVAYVNAQGDVVIPFGKYAYFGTDTLKHYSNVMIHPNDSTFGKAVAIDNNQNVLFDLVMYDNGPDYFSEGLIRVLRNDKMGFANEFGEVVIPCIYDYAKPFYNGVAEVTFKVKEILEMGEHQVIESDEWIEINKEGEKVD